ncbi:winged helix-turn-helix domain-containing protein [Caballeronia sp. GaOx3]|uniref:winged helix-turn-helix domain-containing protein n=1 Tax=Caballeronia sp. GaOx3 TaxID=2921740 RepID=UPI002028846F|nr:winged helix-turn-helix domain-containing protein [Caballeronia sp. GaOx3]
MKNEDFPKSVAAAVPAKSAAAAVLHYPGFDVDMARGELRVDGRPVALRPKTFTLLLHLAQNPRRLISRDELIEAVWREVIVTDDSLVQVVSELRAALGTAHQHAVRTVPRRGYMLDVPELEAHDNAQAEHDASKLAAPRPVASTSESPRSEHGLPGTRLRSPGNLPTELPPLFGRAEDVAALARALEISRVVSVVGSAGIGKTRVGQAVAYQLRDQPCDGVWLVELASLADPRLLVPTVARVLGHQVAKDDGQKMTGLRR